MGQFIEFFPRQAVVGNGAGNVTIRTSVVDVSDYDKLDIEMEGYTFGSGAAISGQIEATDRPCMSGFGPITPAIGLSGVGTVSGTGLTIERFVRGAITIPAGQVAMISFRGRAYDS